MLKTVARGVSAVLIAVFVLFTFAAQAGVFWISREYYTDAAMTNNAGWWETDCNGFDTYGGVQHAEFRRIVWDPCDPGYWGTVHCHQYVNGQWVKITCPY